jgi:hypothetical protein
MRTLTLRWLFVYYQLVYELGDFLKCVLVEVVNLDLQAVIFEVRY